MQRSLIRIITRIAIALTATIALAQPALAGRVINVDYGNGGAYTGQGALGVGGPNWNLGELNPAPQSSHALFGLDDSFGQPTDVLAVLSTISGSFDQGTYTSGNTNDLTQDYFVQNEPQAPWTLSIQGLDPQRRYALVLYGYRAATGTQGTDFDVDGIKQTTSGNSQGVGSGFSLGDTHVVYSNLAPTNGQILVTIGVGNDETNAFLNGFQLEESDGLVLTIAPGGEQLVDWSGDAQDDDDTGIRIKNLSGGEGTVGVLFKPNEGLEPGDTITPGFAMVDGTLEVTSDIPAGELRIRYRVEYARASLRANGIRANQVRMLRQGARRARWGRAIRALRGRAQVRYLRDARADFVLGHHGFSRARRYAWAVLDVNSEYAAGGPVGASNVPVGPAVVVGIGVTLMGVGAWASRKR